MWNASAVRHLFDLGSCFGGVTVSRHRVACRRAIFRRQPKVCRCQCLARGGTSPFVDPRSALRLFWDFREKSRTKKKKGRFRHGQPMQCCNIETYTSMNMLPLHANRIQVSLHVLRRCSTYMPEQPFGLPLLTTRATIEVSGSTFF